MSNVKGEKKTKKKGSTSGSTVDTASGCVVTSRDLPFVVGTVACCLCFLVYGAAAASLGAALPALSTHFHQSTARLGVFFTSRGVGYTLGTLGSAYALQSSSLSQLPSLSKETMTCLAILLTGLATAAIDHLNDYAAAVPLFVVQGLGFGGLDTMANLALPEMWGIQRVQPWMQAMHACFGLGAIAGPAAVGATGYRTAFTVIAIASACPLLSLAAYRLGERLLASPGVLLYASLFQRDEDSSAFSSFFSSSSFSSSSSSSSSRRRSTIRFELEDDLHESELARHLPAAVAVADGDFCDNNGRENNSHRNDNSNEYSAVSVTSNSIAATNNDYREVNSNVNSKKSSNNNSDHQHEKENEVDDNDKVCAPLYLKLIMSSFFFLYVGMETGFAGWIPAYALAESVTTNDAAAAYLSAIFWAALTAGRLLSIPLAIVLSSATLIRFQLLCGVLSCLCAVSLLTASYAAAAATCAFVGFSLSSMFPVMLTLIDNYGFQR
jgi:fucose permease